MMNKSLKFQFLYNCKSRCSKKSKITPLLAANNSPTNITLALVLQIQHAQQQSLGANIVNALDNVPNYKFSCYMLVMFSSNYFVCIMTVVSFRILCLSETCVVQNAVLIYSIASFGAYLLINFVIGQLNLVYLQPFQAFLFYPTNETYVQRFHVLCMGFLGFLCPLAFPTLAVLFVIIIKQCRTRRQIRIERQLKPKHKPTINPIQRCDKT